MWGAVLVPFFVQFGAVLGQHTYTCSFGTCWYSYGVILVQFWCSFGAVLGQLWCSFGAFLVQQFWWVLEFCKFPVDAVLVQFWCSLVQFYCVLCVCKCTFVTDENVCVMFSWLHTLFRNTDTKVHVRFCIQVFNAITPIGSMQLISLSWYFQHTYVDLRAFCSFTFGFPTRPPCFITVFCDQFHICSCNKANAMRHVFFTCLIPL